MSEPTSESQSRSGSESRSRPEEFSKQYWEEQYRGHLEYHGKQPNTQLVAEVRDLPPGIALDAGCGEGADAIWLAGRGWRVLAVDIASTALRSARTRAEALDPAVSSRIDWLEADLSEWIPPEEEFDLVSAHYVHPATDREQLFRRLAASVAPGGTLLLVGHHGHGSGSGDRPTADAHGPAPASQVTVEELAAGLDAEHWDIAVAETRTHAATDHHGHQVPFVDAVLRARKR